MVFHARQHMELNPSHHVGPDATSHRPLTLIVYHISGKMSIVKMHKVCEKKLLELVILPKFRPLRTWAAGATFVQNAQKEKAVT